MTYKSRRPHQVTLLRPTKNPRQLRIRKRRVYMSGYRICSFWRSRSPFLTATLSFSLHRQHDKYNNVWEFIEKSLSKHLSKEWKTILLFAPFMLVIHTSLYKHVLKKYNNNNNWLDSWSGWSFDIFRPGYHTEKHPQPVHARIWILLPLCLPCCCLGALWLPPGHSGQPQS